MEKIYFTCGPSQLYPTVKNHIGTALNEGILSVSHRSKKFQEIYKTAQNNLRQLLGIPKSCRIFFLSSSLESMERIIENCVEKYSFHFVNGSFSEKWYEISASSGRKAQKQEFGWGSGYDPSEFRIAEKNELVCVTQNETSTGVAINVKSINLFAQASRLRKNKLLLAVDMVSSAPYINLDFNKIDLTFFSAQKGFGLPSGLSILIVSERAIKKNNYLENKGFRVGSYHSFLSMEEKNKIFQTPETPNVLGIYLLAQVCGDMLKKGIKEIRKETEVKAKIIYNFFDNHKKYQPQVKDKLLRSMTTININIRNDKKKIMKKLAAKGIVVSPGYGRFKDSHIRIANFPAHTVTDTARLVNLIGYN